MSRPIRLKWYLVAAAMLGLVACSNNSTATASPTPSSTSAKAAAPAAAAPNPSQVDRCTLLTAQEASQLAGVTVTHAQGGGVGSAAPCVYTAGTKVNVYISLTALPDGLSAKTAYDTGVQAAQARGVNPIALPGLGDEAAAVITPKAPGVANVYVIKGSIVLVIGTTIISGQMPTIDALKTAANTAVSRF